MRDVERRIAALLGEEGEAEEQQRPSKQQQVQPPSKQQQQQQAPAGQGGSLTADEQRRMQPKMVYWESSGPVQPIVGRQAAVPGGGGSIPGELRLVAAGVSMPHPAKASSGGEDAFFVSSWGQGAIGVADGVGGWAAEGVNPALYPRRLMTACEEALAPSGRGLLQEEPCCQNPRCRDSEPSSSSGGASSSGSTDGGESTPARPCPPPGAAFTVLQSAHQRTSEPGSCTVIVAVLQPGGQLSVANLGDTELRVVRGGRVAFKTKVSGVHHLRLEQPVCGKRASRQQGWQQQAFNRRATCSVMLVPCLLACAAVSCTSPAQPAALQTHARRPPLLPAGAGAHVEHAAAAELPHLLRLRQPAHGCGPGGAGGAGGRHCGAGEARRLRLCWWRLAVRAPLAPRHALY